MSNEIKLIAEIEKHQCLYNFNIPEYNRKEVIENSWGQVAASINSTVTECKDKWRNIRSSFLRSLKPHGSKLKKPYYLSDFLQFLLPYMKPLNYQELPDESQMCETQTNHTSSSDILINSIKTEIGIEIEADDSDYEGGHDVGDMHDAISANSNYRSSMMRKRKRQAQLPRNYTLLKKIKKFNNTSSMKTDALNEDEENPMKLFLMSLVPELDSMSAEQIRLFKIKVMILIDEIKTSFDEVKQKPYSTRESDRLQKRLINLLLKSLKKT